MKNDFEQAFRLSSPRHVVENLHCIVQECVEHTLRKDQKITKNTKNICLKDKKEKKQINNAGFW